MNDYPRTGVELEDRFCTEEDCLVYLAKLRWPAGFVLPGLPPSRLAITIIGKSTRELISVSPSKAEMRQSFIPRNPLLAERNTMNCIVVLSFPCAVTNP